MDYLKIANSPILYVVTALILTILIAQALLFYFSAKKQLESMKVDKKVVRKVILASGYALRKGSITTKS